MEIPEFIRYIDEGNPIVPGTPEHMFMCELSQRALQITMKLNSAYHSPGEIREI